MVPCRRRRWAPAGDCQGARPSRRRPQRRVDHFGARRRPGGGSAPGHPGMVPLPFSDGGSVLARCVPPCGRRGLSNGLAGCSQDRTSLRQTWGRRLQIHGELRATRLRDFDRDMRARGELDAGHTEAHAWASANSRCEKASSIRWVSGRGRGGRPTPPAPTGGSAALNSPSSSEWRPGTNHRPRSSGPRASSLKRSLTAVVASRGTAVHGLSRRQVCPPNDPARSGRRFTARQDTAQRVGDVAHRRGRPGPAQGTAPRKPSIPAV